MSQGSNLSNFLPATRRRDGNAQKHVQNIAYHPSSQSSLASPFAWRRVRMIVKRCGLCMAGCVHIGCVHRKIGGSNLPEHIPGWGVKDEVFGGGCDRTGGY